MGRKYVLPSFFSFPTAFLNFSFISLDVSVRFSCMNICYGCSLNEVSAVSAALFQIPFRGSGKPEANLLSVLHIG